jgi:peptide/nickel transport system permease protein
MGKYVLKRLCIAVPTLLGISFITFLLIRLAPGDPTTVAPDALMDGGTLHLSPERVERTRRLYGLDKPVFINVDVKDRQRTVLATWADYEAVPPGQEEEEKRQGGKLLALGKRIIPELVPMALSAGEGKRLDRLLFFLQEGAGLEGIEDQASLSAWWQDHEQDFRGDALKHAVSQLEQCTVTEASRVAKRLHEALAELALPEVMDRIHALDKGSARKRLVAFAAPWAGYSQTLLPDSPEKRYEAALRHLEQWWSRDGLAYRDIGPAERFLKTFTEAQFPIWLGQIIRLDFGDSYIDNRPVTEMVWEAFKVTFTFQIVAIFLIYIIAVPLGVYAAVRQGRLADRLITLGLFALYSLPNFWVAYMLILLVGQGNLAGLFPIQGLNSGGAENLSAWAWFLDRLWHMVLPVVCMTYGGLAVFSRYARSGMLEVIKQDYIRTARAKGLSERAVVMRHALRNAVIPIVTLIGGLLPALISGSVIIETIFGIPGMGRLGFMAVLQRDYPVVMAIAFFTAVLVLIGMLISDLLYAWVDPRISFEREAS